MNKQQRVGKFVKGSAVAGEIYDAYLPQALPPSPPLDMTTLYPLVEKAGVALGRLDGIRTILPDASLFLSMYLKKEAVLSSQIEGTQSSLSDLLLFESEEKPFAPIDDVTEVFCYVEAMNYGLERIKEIPLSLRLIREIHQKLMNNTRGGQKQPGEFRTTQNWIGGPSPRKAIFVPPPPQNLLDLLDDFEKFLHDKTVQYPALIKAALVHVQFETLHPFLDGNGRLGRLLITFILCHEGILKEPLLYLSLYLKSNRQIYYDLLQSVRTRGDWESWIEFFLKGVIETAEQATKTAQKIFSLFEEDRNKIIKSGKSTSAILTLHTHLQKQPVSMTNKIKNNYLMTLPTVLRSLKVLEDLGIVREITGRDRHKVFVYHQFLSLLSEGTEPL